MQSITSRRCSICAITYPSTVRVCRVEGCGEETWPLRRDIPDADWEEAVALRNRRNRKDAEEAEPESIYPHPPDARVRVYKAHDRLWVSHPELLMAGYKELTDDSIIFINDTFYELQGYSDKGGAWWVETVEIDGAAESLEPWMFNAEA